MAIDARSDMTTRRPWRARSEWDGTFCGTSELVRGMSAFVATAIRHPVPQAVGDKPWIEEGMLVVREPTGASWSYRGFIIARRAPWATGAGRLWAVPNARWMGGPWIMGPPDGRYPSHEFMGEYVRRVLSEWVTAPFHRPSKKPRFELRGAEPGKRSLQMVYGQGVVEIRKWRCGWSFRPAAELNRLALEYAANGKRWPRLSVMTREGERWVAEVSEQEERREVAAGG
jgi:hypothetical protein